jgi:hypothetical protein
MIDRNLISVEEIRRFQDYIYRFIDSNFRTIFKDEQEKDDYFKVREKAFDMWEYIKELQQENEILTKFWESTTD